MSFYDRVCSSALDDARRVSDSAASLNVKRRFGAKGCRRKVKDSNERLAEYLDGFISKYDLESFVELAPYRDGFRLHIIGHNYYPIFLDVFLDGEDFVVEDYSTEFLSPSAIRHIATFMGVPEAQVKEKVRRLIKLILKLVSLNHAKISSLGDSKILPSMVLGKFGGKSQDSVADIFDCGSVYALVATCLPEDSEEVYAGGPVLRSVNGVPVSWIEGVPGSYDFVNSLVDSVDTKSGKVKCAVRKVRTSRLSNVTDSMLKVSDRAIMDACQHLMDIPEGHSCAVNSVLNCKGGEDVKLLGDVASSLGIEVGKDGYAVIPAHSLIDVVKSLIGMFKYLDVSEE